MKIVNLFIALSIFLMGLAACNDEEGKQLPVFTETVEFEDTGVSFLENTGAVTIPVILSGFAKTDVQVTVKIDTRTKDTTAVEGEHFTLPQKTITIPAGKSIGEIPLSIINDNEVNVNRSFRLWITEINGAEAARISQLIRVTIVNEDFWPEIQFSAAQYRVTEHEDQLIIPLKIQGVFYQPMDVSLTVTDGTALQGVNFAIQKTSFQYTASQRDSIVVTIPHQDLSEDLSFNLDLEVLNGGITGEFKSAKVTIKDVRKIVKFTKARIPVLVNANPVLIPVWFSGVRSSRDVTATVRVKNAGGLSPGDYTLEDDVLACKGDTVLYAKLKLREGVSLPAMPLEFEISDVTGGEIDPLLNVAAVEVSPGKKIDPILQPWVALSWTSEELTGEDGGNSGHAKHMIDGKMETFWHSRWQSGFDNGPFEIVVDMKESIEIEKICLYRRQQNNNSNAKKATVEVSTDKSHWGTKYEYNFTAGGLVLNGLEKTLPVSVKGRYVRVTVTECSGNNTASLAELVIWGLVQ